MSLVKTPIRTQWGPSREPASGTAVPTLASPADHSHVFDFRSSQFGADARTLARATGASLQACRQELFIAEGDMALAFELLTAGYETEPVTPTLH